LKARTCPRTPKVAACACRKIKDDKMMAAMSEGKIVAIVLIVAAVVPFFIC
jgi:hypothetical protein